MCIYVMCIYVCKCVYTCLVYILVNYLVHQKKYNFQTLKK